MHLREPGFTYSNCGSFTKNEERMQKFRGTGDSEYIYQNLVHKACFQHDMAYGDFKDLTRFKQLLINYCVIRHLILLKILNMMDIKEVLLQWFINVLIKRLLLPMHGQSFYMVVLSKTRICQNNNQQKN